MAPSAPSDPSPHVEATLTLAHALRTPLTSLSLGLGSLEGGVLGELNEAQREIVRALIGDVARLSLLVDRALQTDRLGAYAGPVERSPIDLSDLVKSAGAPIVAQACERQIRVTSALPSGIIVIADPVKLGWVISSLMGNALRYSPSSATIDVELRAEEQAELAVSDQGPGVPEEVRARIFDRAWGRGLFLAREIVEAHGGELLLRSRAGGGSTFMLTLPLSEARGW